MDELFKELIRRAIQLKATDIHFAYSRQKTDCSFRTAKGFVDYQHTQLVELFQYIKYLANLDIGNLSIPQSNSFTCDYQNQKLYFRFSVIETQQMQSGVLRILNNHQCITIDNLSIEKAQTRLFKQWCQRKSGLILFTGPTGSGKSTTLNALLNHIAKNKQLKVMSIEDPVEIINQNIVQLQVNEKLNFTYEEGIKQLLRHDPDVIMIGEIRDPQTAAMVYRCALSGHLVFTTLHAKNCFEAIKRLNELGLSTHELENTLSAIVNQRLLLKTNGKERVCIYEILCDENLSNYLSNPKQVITHQNITAHIQRAIDDKVVSPKSAKFDLCDF